MMMRQIAPWCAVTSVTDGYTQVGLLLASYIPGLHYL